MILKEAKSDYDWFDLTDEGLQPAGMFPATILKIEDRIGVERPKFENPNEMEKLDMTCFLFGFRDGDNKPHRIATMPMRIPKLSKRSREKSNLLAMLRGILGREPQSGWDYCELKGKTCWIEVKHAQGKDDNTYATVTRCMTEEVAKREIAQVVAAQKALQQGGGASASVAAVPDDRDDGEEIPF